MARLAILLLSEDDRFRQEMTSLLRGGGVSVTVSAPGAPAEASASADIVIVDGRGEAAPALARIERVRAAHATVAIFMIAGATDPALILQAMRAGANEFLAWPAPLDALQDALGRTAARLATSAERAPATTLVFAGAKGGAGTTTVAVNCGVELARLSAKRTILVDLKPGFGEVSLFLGIRSRYTLLDAIENVHRLDAQFLRELVATHKSGVDMLAGSEHLERPASGDVGAIEEVLRLLAREYDYILIDAGTQITACSLAALYTSDTIFLVANPDVPSVRNAQRLLDRIRQLGACGERVRLVLNRAAADASPIPPEQIESALGQPIHQMFPSDYRTVSAALNSGVPLSLSGKTDLAAQFDAFTRRILDPDGASAAAAPRTRGPLGLDRLASLW